MKLNKLKFLFAVWVLVLMSCNNSKSGSANLAMPDRTEVEQSVLSETDSSVLFPMLSERINEIKTVLQQPTPVLLLKDSISAAQQLAESLALKDSSFTQFLKDPFENKPYRNEIFGVYPARESDMVNVKMPYQLSTTYRVEMYNYALNNTSIALVDIQQQKVVASYFLKSTQPDISAYLRKLAIQIAAASPEVQNALGVKPEEKDAWMANSQTALNRSRCERSRHLCVAPTFIKDDKALFAIVDLTDLKLVGVRWTQVGKPGDALPLLTEKRLQDDKVTACYCEVEQKLEKNGWSMKYMLTSSDGLRISEVTYQGKPVLRNVKLVDWHVSYSGTDGFGYSDAVGCPYFSQSAVVAWEPPKILEIKDNRSGVKGFVLEQTYRSEGWPLPCNYNYKQRYEFYNDGSFRIAAASLGRGCGNTGTYRPVFRIAMAGDQNNFYQWKNNNWTQWENENWNEQGDQSTYTPEGYLYKTSAQGGYYIEPGKGQFGDGGRGDFSFVYVTKNNPAVEEGERDLPTIGPCCNTDYHQGPEKFIESSPENIQNSSLVVWYVSQMRNDDRKGYEYCWAVNQLENGVWKTEVYPCFSGPFFKPVK